MRISVVIPAFNEERLLAASLRSVRVAMEALAQPGWSSDLIVCDNNSTDWTPEIAAVAGARVVFEPINGALRGASRGTTADVDAPNRTRTVKS